MILFELDLISRVFDQNGVSQFYIMIEIHLSGREPSIYIVQDINS